MKLSDKLNNKTILRLQSNNKIDVLHELLDCFCNINYLKTTVKLFSYLEKKSNINNLTSSRGIAYHYNTSTEINETIAVLGISKRGIDYKASDGLMCNFILLVLDPESKSNSHRLIINLFQDLIKDINLKDKLLEANLSDEIFNMICEWEENQNKIEL
mgnify:CR=1 FL=1